MKNLASLSSQNALFLLSKMKFYGTDKKYLGHFRGKLTEPQPEAARNLESLTLRDSFFSDKTIVDKLASAIRNHPKLIQLTFDQCNFTSETSHAMVVSSKHLEELVFFYMSPDDVSAILKNDQYLKQLIFSQLKINSSLVDILSSIIKNSQSIQKIKIEDCVIEDDLNSIVKAYEQADRTIDFFLDDSIDENIKESLNNRTKFLKRDNNINLPFFPANNKRTSKASEEPLSIQKLVDIFSSEQQKNSVINELDKTGSIEFDVVVSLAEKATEFSAMLNAYVDKKKSSEITSDYDQEVKRVKR